MSKKTYKTVLIKGLIHMYGDIEREGGEEYAMGLDELKAFASAGRVAETEFDLKAWHEKRKAAYQEKLKAEKAK